LSIIPVDGGVVGRRQVVSPLFCFTGKSEIVLMEPAQRLPRAAKLLHLVEGPA